MPEHFSVAKYLIENQKVDINQQNLDGSSALHCAAYNKNIELCRLLIDHNANKEAGDSEGSTPLMYAVMANQPSIVFKLLNKGCNQLTKRYDGLDAIALSKKLKHKICTAKMMGHLKKYPKS